MRHWKSRDIPDGHDVTIVMASYLNENPHRRLLLDATLASLRAQTYSKFRVDIVHDGPLDPGEPLTFDWDERFHFHQTPTRINDHGHSYRWQYASQAPTPLVGFANDDHYFCPVYLEWMAAELAAHPDLDIVYCDLIHSHQQWKLLKTQPKVGRIDVSGWLARTELIRRTPWTDYGFTADGIYFEKLFANARRAGKIDAALLVHN